MVVGVDVDIDFNTGIEIDKQSISTTILIPILIVMGVLTSITMMHYIHVAIDIEFPFCYRCHFLSRCAAVRRRRVLQPNLSASRLTSFFLVLFWFVLGFLVMVLVLVLLCVLRFTGMFYVSRFAFVVLPYLIPVLFLGLVEAEVKRWAASEAAWNGF